MGKSCKPFEIKVYKDHKTAKGVRAEKVINSYTVKVGDVCLVAIGQIVGRDYQAVRYQPTANIVINSPTQNAELRQQVRTIWSSKDSRRRVFDSLLYDYATHGKWKEGDSLDKWYVGSHFQTAAAMRLLYYFPKETAPMIAQRLVSLRVERTGPGAGTRHTEKEMKAWTKREVANGVRTDDFVNAVSWSKEPAIKSAVHSIFERTEDVDILIGSLPGIDRAESELIERRIESFLNKVPKEEKGAYGDGYNLLVALVQSVPEQARPIFQNFIRDASSTRCYSICEIFKETHPAWATDLLKPLLQDQRTIPGYTHSASTGDGGNRLPIRVCDSAADTLSQIDSKLKFRMVGTKEELDRQIQVIQRQLARTNK
jgi:hypothetical protein